MASQGNTPLLSTERLYLREFDPSDAPFLYALNSNPDVLRYTGDTAFADTAAAESYLKDYDHYARFGFGRWAVILKREERFIGFSGLRMTEESREVDLGFRFFAEYWSQGYATEAGHAALRLGFERFQLNRVVGRAMRENRPSITVLQKIGMEYYEVREESGILWLIYGIDRARWNALTSTRSPRDP